MESTNPSQTASTPYTTQRSLLLIILSGAILFVIVGCGAYYLGTQNNKNSQVSKVPTESTSAIITNKVSLADCLTKPETINSLSITHPQDDCYLENAVEEKDEGICNSLKYYSKDECYADVAVAKRDVTMCRQVQFHIYKDNCFKEIAVIKNDSSLCELVADDTQKDMCYLRISEISKDIRICESMKNHSSSFYDECLYNIALSTRDASLCKKINTYTDPVADRGKTTPGWSEKCIEKLSSN